MKSGFYDGCHHDGNAGVTQLTNLLLNFVRKKNLYLYLRVAEPLNRRYATMCTDINRPDDIKFEMINLLVVET